MAWNMDTGKVITNPILLTNTNPICRVDVEVSNLILLFLNNQRVFSRIGDEKRFSYPLIILPCPAPAIPSQSYLCYWRRKSWMDWPMHALPTMYLAQTTFVDQTFWETPPFCVYNVCHWLLAQAHRAQMQLQLRWCYEYCKNKILSKRTINAKNVPSTIKESRIQIFSIFSKTVPEYMHYILH